MDGWLTVWCHANDAQSCQGAAPDPVETDAEVSENI